MWQRLNTLQKIIIVVLLACLVPFAPELIFIADIGGVELVFTFLLAYYAPLLSKVKARYYQGKNTVNFTLNVLQASPIFTPYVFAIQASFSLLALFISGSIALALLFQLPAMLLNHALLTSIPY